MLVTIPNLLDVEELAQVYRILKSADFVSGSRSAGIRATRVKNNTELPLGTAELESLNRIVMGKLVRHDLYRDAALPLKVAAPFYARYTEGMYYGPHIDDPVMGDGPRYRSDVSITIFLNAPEAYDGGELCIGTSFGEQVVKLNAGSAVLYPSSSLHRVNEVTRGERLVAVTWVQSMVPGVERRELLFTLAMARKELLDSLAQPNASDLVDQAYVNLVRMWSQV